MIIPPGLTFKQAVQKGYVKPYRNKPYLNWVKTCQCCVCGMPADDAHHIIDAGLGGMGTKAPDLFTMPMCRTHHNIMHTDIQDGRTLKEYQWEAIAYTLLQALEEGVISL